MSPCLLRLSRLVVFLSALAALRVQAQDSDPECIIPVCGDCVVDVTEECDDGNTDNDDACRNDCTLPDDKCPTDGGPPSCDVDKVEVCHVPPGNPGNAHTICISPAAVPAHLNHGDDVGACEAECPGDANASVCGNADVEDGEECDDGNRDNQDDCRNDCTVPDEECPDSLGVGSLVSDCVADGKVVICHIPPGNPGNAHSICVSINAQEAHLDHGDQVGVCPLECPSENGQPLMASNRERESAANDTGGGQVAGCGATAGAQSVFVIAGLLGLMLRKARRSKRLRIV